jgi:hypothetical protein
VRLPPQHFNAKLADIDEFKVDAQVARASRVELRMPNEGTNDDVIRDADKWLLKEQARVMLELFEEDCGRTPTTLEEVREWARAQNDEHLKFRVNRRLDVVLDAYATTPAPGHQ